MMAPFLVFFGGHGRVAPPPLDPPVDVPHPAASLANRVLSVRTRRRPGDWGRLGTTLFTRFVRLVSKLSAKLSSSMPM